MSYRCTNAFLYNDRIYAGGQIVDDDNPILKTHRDNFVEVLDPRVGTETATSAPGEVRTPTLAAADRETAEAWLAAESQYEEDVQAWLLAEEQYRSEAAARAEAQAAPATKARPQQRRK